MVAYVKMKSLNSGEEISMFMAIDTLYIFLPEDRSTATGMT